MLYAMPPYNTPHKKTLWLKPSRSPRRGTSWAGTIVAMLVVAVFVVAYRNLDITMEMLQRPPVYLHVPPATPYTPIAPYIPVAPPRYYDTPAQVPSEIFDAYVNAAFLIKLSDDGHSWSGTGSGFFVCETGMAVTNHHVMVGAQRAVIVMQDGREFEIVGYYSYDIGNDYAIIQVDGEGAVFQYVSFGEPDYVQVNDDVTIISSPGGVLNRLLYGPFIGRPSRIDFGCTITGIIYTIYYPLQYLAHTEPGSSGGAVFNDSGQVVGVNAAGDALGSGIGAGAPITRLNFDGIIRGEFHPLPLQLPIVHAVFVYHSFQTVPTFGGISDEAGFVLGMPADGNLQAMHGHITHLNAFEYMYFYQVSREGLEDSIRMYADALLANGFVFLDEVLYFDNGTLYNGRFYTITNGGLDVGRYIYSQDDAYIMGAFRLSMAYFYNADIDASIAVSRAYRNSIINISVGHGDIYAGLEGPIRLEDTGAFWANQWDVGHHEEANIPVQRPRR